MKQFSRYTKRPEFKKPQESWEGESRDYNRSVGESGHYFHQHVVLPGVIKLLNLKPESKLLELGCGQGVLPRAINKDTKYVGVDSAKTLLKSAQSLDHNTNHLFIETSATKPLPKVVQNDFTHAAIVLALQNMERSDLALKNISEHLVTGGKLVLVLNHPAFRIPRQSGWGELPNKLQYRWINKYMSYLKIPIIMHPGAKHSTSTISFHNPISYYAKTLSACGFVITGMEEWTSDKQSQGKASKMENRARSEFPLFLAITAEKR